MRLKNLKDLLSYGIHAEWLVDQLRYVITLGLLTSSVTSSPSSSPSLRPNSGPNSQNPYTFVEREKTV